MSNNQPERHTYSPNESAAESADELKQSEQIVDEDDAKRAADQDETKDNS
jgi:hypothetical protein